MARRVLLHVGCPKTGTSFLQGALWGSRDALAEQGLVVPLSYNHHYRASLFVRDVWRRRPAAAEIEADWHQVVRTVHETDQDVLISHESLAAATPSQARLMIDALGGAETHLVITARDLARQLPAEWQQSVKQGSTLHLEEFVHDVVHRGPRAAWFWRVQDVPDIIRRWAGDLPLDRVHVITVPPKGTDPAALWTRFASVLGVDPGLVELQGGRRNESLGSVEVELLRRINEGRGDRFPVIGNQRWFKSLLANDVLARRPEKLMFALSQEVHEWVCDASQEMVKAIGDLGCNVVGDLDELIPPVETAHGADPGQVDEQALLQAAIGAILDLLDMHRSRVEALEHWRDLAVWRGDRVAEKEQQRAELEQQVAGLEQRRLPVRGRRVLGRIRRKLRRPSV